MRVYEVATFYTMFNRYAQSSLLSRFVRTCSSEPIGKNLCKSAPQRLVCSEGQQRFSTLYAKNSEVSLLSDTKDGKFTVIEVECQGACSNAPMMVIGDDFYVRFTVMFSLPS